MGSFLTAEWRKLVIANYEVDASTLEKFLPNGTVIDFWEDKCYISLVGFMFTNTRFLGIPIPFHTHFEEVNLRFYVLHNDGKEWKRGVVFIKEIVPKHAVSFVANTVYKEHYDTLPMRHQWIEEEDRLSVSYQWKKGKRWNNITVEAQPALTEITEGSEAEFITEHYWGYTKVDDLKTYEYEVTHPRWQQYKVEDYTIDIDFEATYGREFAGLNKLRPTSVMLAEGSGITVERKKTIG